jgi:hypothetical protein
MSAGCLLLVGFLSIAELQAETKRANMRHEVFGRRPRSALKREYSSAQSNMRAKASDWRN